jgi:hypothetical protein
MKDHSSKVYMVSPLNASKINTLKLINATVKTQAVQNDKNQDMSLFRKASETMPSTVNVKPQFTRKSYAAKGYHFRVASW